MKAAVLHGAKDIRTETIPDPVCEPHGVIIQVKACGIRGIRKANIENDAALKEKLAQIRHE